MRRTFACCLLLLGLAGCRLPGESMPLPPLPEDSPPLTYGELLTRARMQISSAHEAFYIDRWGELEDGAKGLEQTARFLAKATEVPARHKDKLAKESEQLLQHAGKLREAALAKDVKKSNEILQQMNLLVRELRPQE